MNNNKNPDSGGEEVRPRVGWLMVVSIVLGVWGAYAALVYALSLPLGDPSAQPELALLLLLSGTIAGIYCLVVATSDGRRLVGAMKLYEFFVGCMIFGIALVLIAPIFANSREQARRVSCQSNMKQLGLGMMQDVQDYDETYPRAENWNEMLDPYVKSARVYQCPQADAGDMPTYAMNRRLGGISLNNVHEPTELVALFDSIPGRNLSGGTLQLPPRPRHNGGDNICFADGHVKWFAREEGLGLRWEPK